MEPVEGLSALAAVALLLLLLSVHRWRNPRCNGRLPPGSMGLPLVGETVAASAGHSLAGGKGANQAACGGRLALGPTYLVARVGDDANGRLLEGALADAGGVRLDRVARAPGAPSGGVLRGDLPAACR